MISAFQPPIVILANGQFPTHPVPLHTLHNAGTVICTDGSGDTLLKMGHHPHIMIGDLDSTDLQSHDFKGLWIPVTDQETTDLQKALSWCLVNQLTTVTILGATGNREDHSLGNLHALAEFSSHMNIHIVSDYASIYCLEGKRIFSCKKGQQISIVAIEAVKSLSTDGLKYPLNNEPFPPACNGISNEALGNTFAITSTDKIWLFINHSS